MNNFFKLVLTAFIFVSLAPTVHASDPILQEDDGGGVTQRKKSTNTDASSSASSSGSVGDEAADKNVAQAARWAYVSKVTKWLASWVYKDVTENPERAKSRLAFLKSKSFLIPAVAVTGGVLAYMYDPERVMAFGWSILAPVLGAYAGINDNPVTGGDTGTGVGSSNTVTGFDGSGIASQTAYPNTSMNPFN